MLHLVLVSPEMPANVGNIMRTAVALDATLHIVLPTPLKFDDASINRAGLDYINKLVWKTHKDFAAFWATCAPTHFYFISRYGRLRYDKVKYAPVSQIVILIFGNVSHGLPAFIHEHYNDFLLRIPMAPNVRSLNLSNSVALVAYEVMRQRDFANLATQEVIKRGLK